MYIKNNNNSNIISTTVVTPIQNGSGYITITTLKE